MDWKDLVPKLGTIAPILGTLIGGPVAPAIGAIVSAALGTDNTPDAIEKAITADPASIVKLREVEKSRQVEIQALMVQHLSAELAAATAQLQAVNQTMQAETKAEHWWSSGWRPYIGFITGTMVFGVYFVLPLAKIPVPEVPTEVWLMLGAILGVASWWRGRAQADPNNPIPATRG